MDLGLAATVLIALIGVIVIQREMSLRRRDLAEETKLRRAELEEEQKDREEQRALMRHRAESISRLSADLGEEIARQLKTDASWAAEALNRTLLAPTSRSLFLDRLGHFNEEKKFLARELTPILIERFRVITADGAQVILLIDSGTTLFPFFEVLGNRAVEAFISNEQWVRHVTVVTNNLPGIQAIMETGRLSVTNRFSPLVIDCEVLPGRPLPIYAAVVGDKTLEGIRAATNANDAHVIALTTGNWLRLRRSDPPCPVPLAREPAHLEVKKVLLEVSDEIYVVSPLGKILVEAARGEINTALGLSSAADNPALKAYDEVDNVVPPVLERIRLITTSRRDGRILARLSERVASRFALKDGDSYELASAVGAGKLVPHIMFPFDNLPFNRAQELDVEFPHEKTRRGQFMRDFFFVRET